MDVIKKYVEKYTLIPHQFDSFHDFIYNGIANVIRDEPSVMSYQGNEILFNNIRFKKPYININNQIKKPLYPNEARRQGLTYKFDIIIDVIIDNIKSTILLCSLPCMVGSRLCNLYEKTSYERYNLGELLKCTGGFFIINGKERAIIAQGRKTYNKMFCCKDSSQEYVCEMRSFCEETAKSSNITLKFNKKITDIIIHVDKQNYPISQVLKEFGYIECFSEALGTDYIFLEEIMYFISLNIEESSYQKSQTLDVSQMFPHLKLCDNSIKITFLGKMARKLCLTHINILLEDDKSHLSIQRLDPVGILCKDLFKMMWKQFIKSLTKDIGRRERGNIPSSINSKKSNFTKHFQASFCTSSWGVDKNSYKKEGVSEFLPCINSHVNHISILKKINKSIGKKDKNIKGRLIESSSEYFVCNYETPEGQAVGSKLALTVLATTSKYSSCVLLQEIVEKFLYEKYNKFLENFNENNYLIFVNGNIIGNTRFIELFCNEFKELRSKKLINRDVSISYNEYLKIIEIWCDSSRYIRPLLNAKKIKYISNLKSASIELLEDLDILVYRDPLELETSYVATYIENVPEDADYIELNPACMMGIITSQIVYSNHAQSPRLCYGSSMGKQAIGYIATKDIRTDNTVYSLNYVQKPLVTTEMANILELNSFPNGVNVIVAIGCLEGFNQEDSLILNKSSIDRGLFNMVCYKTITIELKSGGSKEEILCIPEEKYRLYKDYSKITENGLPSIGTKILKGDIILGKIKKEKLENNEFSIKDESYAAKINDYGTICEVNIISSAVKITIRQNKIPELGDKFCSGSGMAQKATCGMLLTEENMPFTSNGMKPDIVINPHCLPSRMTINQLMSSICAKSRCISGKKHLENGSPFTGLNNVYESMKILESNGLDKNGTEILYNGNNGKRFRAKIMIAPTYYQRLPQIVESKIYSINNAPSKNILTKQPNEGRTKEGGLKFGEMEKDCENAYGSIAFLNEKMLKLSDSYILPICKICKNYNHVVFLKIKDTYICSKCKSHDISFIEIPYATKIMFQLLEAMAIKINII